MNSQTLKYQPSSYRTIIVLVTANGIDNEYMYDLQVLHLIKERPNICNQIHLPAQSGSTTVLQAMRRGYSREVYLDLVHRIRNILPGNKKLIITYLKENRGFINHTLLCQI